MKTLHQKAKGYLTLFCLTISGGIGFSAPIDLTGGEAAQTTTLNSFDASRAIDGNTSNNNFTHTTNADTNPTWQVQLATSQTFEEVVLNNRGGTGSWLPRFRDLTVQIIDFSGDVDLDFTGGTVVFSSPLLNPDNVLGSPDSITASIGGATGNMIRVIRTPDGPNESADTRVLSLQEVTATSPTDVIFSFDANSPIITPGDAIEFNWEVATGVNSLTIDNGVGNVLPFSSAAGVGNRLFSPGPTATTTYELEGSDGTTTSTMSTTITVVDEPLIYSFESDQVFIASGESVNLDWNVGGNVTSLTLNGADVLGTTGSTVSPTENTEYLLVASNENGTVSRNIFVQIIVPSVPIINEFLASNDDGLLDSDGQASDWIELSNPGSTPALLEGYYLTDDVTDLTKWRFPAVTMAPGEFLVVFASGKDRTEPGEELHTNFLLSANGEYLALVQPDGTTIAAEFSPSFPAQRTDVSYGFDISTSELGFFVEPTPGMANNTVVLGFVEDTSFNFDRGFYTSPFALEITSLTTDAQVRYTLDGSKPTATTGLVYSSPINISETTVVRAAAFKDQFEPTNVDTHTYIFKADVIASPLMSTDITQDPTFGPLMDDALSAIPSISLNLAGDIEHGPEKEVSIEFIDFEDGSTQEDAGIERFGSFNTNFGKRSARVTFRSEFGVGRLNFDPFENHDWPSFQPAERYDALELRAGNHDMWQRGAYLSNRFTDDAMLDMGQIAPHGRFVHLYVNGEYNGQYHLRERWNASMLSEYFDGEREDYEAVNANNAGGNFQTGVVYDGSGVEWEETVNLFTGDSPTSTPFTSARDQLDIINEIDFMLLWTSGNSESEFRAAGAPELGVPFKFFIKDADGFLRNPNNRVAHQGPLNAMAAFAAENDPEYKMLLADRIHKHFFNDGALTPASNITRLQDRVAETELSIIAESARWVGPGPLNSFFSMDQALNPDRWRNFQDNLIQNSFPSLTATQIGRFEGAGMYPDIAAPVYSFHGGSIITEGPTLAVEDSNDVVYFVFGPRDTDEDPYRNSLDPRLPGGSVNPLATLVTFDGSGGVPTSFVQSGNIWSYLDDGTDQGTDWRATTFDDSSWESGPSQLGYGNDGEVTEVGFGDNDPNTPDDPDQKNITTYFRKTDINISDPTLFEDFTISYTYDDAIAIYVNGVEVRRVNLPANASFSERSTDTVGNTATGTVQVPISAFNAGDNTIAVEIHQVQPTSSDISFDLSLNGNLLGGSDPALTSDPILVTTSGWLLSRTFNPNTREWSALTEAFFTPEPIPANFSNLIVSEFNYNPADPTAAGELAITNDNDDFEFIELKNVALQPLDLAGVAFTEGIDFTFAANNIIPAGGRIILVRNKAAFEERYSSQLANIVFGTDSIGSSQYGGSLRNSGEQIVLRDAGGSIIHDFTYEDALPWPTAPDGSGFSLVLISQVLPIANHNIATNWAANAFVGGTPGQADPIGFAGDPNADDDGDGFSALLEYALGSSDTFAGDASLEISFGSYEVDGETRDYLTVSYNRNQHTVNSVTIEPQISEDLEVWHTVPDVVLVSEVDNLDGTFSVVYRSAVPVGESPSGREFMRIVVQQN